MLTGKEMVLAIDGAVDLEDLEVDRMVEVVQVVHPEEESTMFGDLKIFPGLVTTPYLLVVPAAAKWRASACVLLHLVGICIVYSLLSSMVFIELEDILASFLQVYGTVKRKETCNLQYLRLMKSVTDNGTCTVALCILFLKFIMALLCYLLVFRPKAKWV
ncbi:hypothetical protein LINGRAHAP2_LOCUS31508 [Linum grandiflorum]